MKPLDQLKLKDLLRIKHRLDPVERKFLESLDATKPLPAHDHHWMDALNSLHVLGKRPRKARTT